MEKVSKQTLELFNDLVFEGRPEKKQKSLN